MAVDPRERRTRVLLCTDAGRSMQSRGDCSSCGARRSAAAAARAGHEHSDARDRSVRDAGKAVLVGSISFGRHSTFAAMLIVVVIDKMPFARRMILSWRRRSATTQNRRNRSTSFASGSDPADQQGVGPSDPR